MSAPRLQPLHAAVVALVALAGAPAHAQQQTSPPAFTPTKPVANLNQERTQEEANKTSSAPMTMREQRARRLAEIKGKSESTEAEAPPKPSMYPNATRVQPEAMAEGRMVRHLQELQELYEKEDYEKAIAKAEAIAAMPAAGAYEKSFAFSMAGNAAGDLDDQARAEGYFRKAVDANGLDNNSHFSTMYNLAVIQYGEEKYADALATLDRFLAESKSDKPEHLALRAGLLAELGRNEEAAAAYKALVAKNPSDKRLLMNAVAALQASEKYGDANALLEDANKRGMLTEERELQSLYAGYLNAERYADAKRVIEDGAAKGILKPGPGLAKAYAILAQQAYFAGNEADAVLYYGKAAPMAEDGESYLNLAKVLSNQGKKAEAKAAAQKALDKGVKKPEEARSILAR